MKPQLAEDAVLDKVIFPCIVQPKIDGVRALNLTGTLTGRSMDPFEGHGITEFFSRPEFKGLDGEMTLGNDSASAERLCSLTTGAMGRFKGVTEMADLHWWCFDYLPDPSLPYQSRYTLLEMKVQELKHPRIHLVPQELVRDRKQLDLAITKFFEKGYEGTIIRNPLAPYKVGRATLAGQQLWRVKPWSDAEIYVTGITEGQKNGNEAKKNTLGRTERSSAKAGMMPNGEVGSIQGYLLKDFFCPWTGKLLFKKGLEITVAPGEMTVKDAKRYFEKPSLIVGHIVTFKHMTHGVKDVPRMPIYKSHRLATDMS
jgi:DNA ligase-1